MRATITKEMALIRTDTEFAFVNSQGRVLILQYKTPNHSGYNFGLSTHGK